jgi:hypothetical protein
MRYFIAPIIFLMFTKFTLGQIQNAKTEILIIGTIHNGNKYFNDKTLVKILEKHNPDIILWEQSEKFKPTIGLLTGFNLKIVKRVSIEQIALQKYSRINKDVKILPYDTVFASKKKYIKRKVKIENAFFNQLNIAPKAFADSLSYANYVYKRNAFYKSIMNLPIAEINKPNIFQIPKDLFLQETQEILPLAKKYIADSLLVKEFENEDNFWIARNNYMVSKILQYSKQFEGKKIIVFTGLYHKYYLNNELEQQKDIALLELETD